ncbi:hypothetical protein FB475_5342 [Kribbella jejuensis]|uniref:Uncharacterized protein n=1 Tax=Kribbella jejuensis TaxID=236068 RepID=A0A542EAR8_9ACTN|nr:hypothetical protein FB475_5342 [Kribbella jejuensis]
MVVSLTKPSTPRLRLLPTNVGTPLLDGAWWPRSADPVAELPGLIVAINRSPAGRVGRMLLDATAWDTQPIRLAVAGRVVRLSYRTSRPTDLLVALCGTSGLRVELLTIPPNTPHDIAELSMARAAGADNQLRLQSLVEGMRAHGVDQSSPQHDTWESEGGRLARASSSPDRPGESTAD